jgi:hypothetical protein
MEIWHLFYAATKLGLEYIEVCVFLFHVRSLEYNFLLYMQ